MLDTVKVRSPQLLDLDARRIERCLQRRSCVDCLTGELMWEFTCGPLHGTWDHRMSVRVEREDWVRIPGQRQPIKVKCRPYLVVEGSLHKALMGHNVYGGPIDLAPAVSWLVDRLSEQWGVALHPGGCWQLRRVDWAHVFDLGSFDAVQEYVGYLHNVQFPRRKVGRYADESVMVSGDRTSVKLYHKGPEFQKHDRGRVGRYIDAESLHTRANMLLRCEVEIHASAIDDEYQMVPAVDSVTVQWIDSLYDRDMGRLMREGASDMNTVRTASAVKARLYDVYTPARARALYGTWLELSAMGEKAARASLSRPTFYRHRAELVAAGVSWHDGDVKLDPRLRLVPEGFSPLRTDPRCIDAEDPTVTAALAPYRRSA